MKKICYSSEIYNLAVEDIISLPDADIKPSSIPNDEVILLIGKRKLWVDSFPITPDSLLKGRSYVEQAQRNNQKYIPVRVAFESRIHAYDIISPLIRSLRYKYNLFSSNIYHIQPQEIRAMKIERNYRTVENAYQFSNPKYQMSESERQNMYEQLKQSMLTNGYDDRFPLDIMLCRNMGIQDTLNQGHHRMSVAIECGIERVSVEFCAAGQAPLFLHPVCKLVAKFNMLCKHLMTKLRH